MTTEQETGRGAAVRRAVPKTGSTAVPRTGARRAGAPHQSKPDPAKPDPAKPAPARPKPAEPAAARSASARSKLTEPKTAAPRTAVPRTAGSRTTGSRTTEPRTAGPRTAGPGRTRPAARPDARPAWRAETGPEPARRRRLARRQRTPFVLLVVGLMSGGLVSLLLLNTMLAKDTITDATLREEIAVARLEKEKIEQEYQRNTQPGVIAERAEQQGQHPDWDNVNGWDSAGDGQVNRVDTER
ncbi:hypothetical protein [Nonomuraea sp. NPDC050783]|uniref:hypothetical protein n=1 Tax=Nonomuraea sp. NPDC050783 TaxID=3154634 RepID=UPI003466F3B8